MSLWRTLLICIGPGTDGSLLTQQLHIPLANKSPSCGIITPLTFATYFV
jgi:hypothetical protein